MVQSSNNDNDNEEEWLPPTAKNDKGCDTDSNDYHHGRNVIKIKLKNTIIMH
jgi:hypothetical protein